MSVPDYFGGSGTVDIVNVIAWIPGTATSQAVLLMAHYDTVPQSPGANDNGSGVAAMLEIARLLAGNSYSSTLRFVAFANEEPPFFYSEEMGSRVYVARTRQRGEQIMPHGATQKKPGGTPPGRIFPATGAAR